MDNISLAIWKASNLAKCSSENKAVGAALVDTADGAAVVVGDVHGAVEDEVGDGALPCTSSVFTFIHTSSLTVKLAEGGPDAGLPSH